LHLCSSLAVQLLVLIFPFGDIAKSLPDVEQIVQLCVRQLDSADQPTRQSLSKLVAHVLGFTQTEYAVPVPEAPKLKKKAPEGLNEDQDNDLAPPVQEMKRLLTPQEMLAQLSAQFNKPNATRRTRVGIFDCYIALLSSLGAKFVENNYVLIVGHFMTDIVSHSRNTASRFEVLFVRKLVDIVLRDLIGVRVLGEQAQISAIQELSNAYLKRWPALMPGQTAPNLYVLVVVLREVAGLLQQLGNAPTPVQDALMDPMMTLLSHPKHSVRISAAWTLRCFCYSTPLRLPKVLLSLVELLQNDLSALVTPAAPSDINARVLGRAYGLAGLLSVISKRPLYASYDISANVFYIAVQQLKRAGEHDVKVAKVEIEVAWTLIASLMTLGPNFVRAHLPQLLVLWRNALPKPTTKDGQSGRSAAEWTFLLSVREYALRAVYSFLTHNSSALLTADVARRVTSLLTNALQFANTFSSQRVVEEVIDGQPQEHQGFSLVHVESLFRSRIYQSFMALGVSKVSETTQASLLQSAISLFASPEGYSGSSVQAAIAASSGAFTSIWQSTDCYAYGVTDIEINENLSPDAVEGQGDWLNRDTINAAIDDIVSC
jgi:HEAT repeat-containing protein 5